MHEPLRGTVAMSFLPSPPSVGQARTRLSAVRSEQARSSYEGTVEPAPARAEDSSVPEGSTCLVCDATAVATLQVPGPTDIERFGSIVLLCIDCDEMIRAGNMAGLGIRAGHNVALAENLVRIASQP